ncbi:MAG TPA: bifunctional phosphoribosylaminoimidazolecarboxamide formyltransferase/IMP cyclohydrolase, partial [candidate division Zixibacteria bacterium]|nr:bifunctional phosphoribosylaminoimidazolecarboxamide formyltransferase/IMP cyclohydrolase [candidate division Zixibacteria bacterium]
MNELKATQTQVDGAAGLVKVRRAIISVSDKAGLVDFARELHALGVEIISTGGTMGALKKAGVHVVPVSSFTGSPEILDGRVKTLHPKVHAGILFRRDNQDHCNEIAALEYKPIDMVVVNLYPFEKTVANPDATRQDIIENIDIGGPSMIRSAAKNFESVAVVTAPEQYSVALQELQSTEGCLSLATRERFAEAAFARTSEYDRFISDYFSRSATVAADADSLPGSLNLQYLEQSSLRYGENPHQRAKFYRAVTPGGPSLANAQILAGKELSYNNIADMDAALEMTLDFERPFACVLKHANPCGAAEADTLAEAYEKALATDPLSAFGSIIGLNRTVDLATAQKLNDTQFIECILAPGYDDDALELLSKKKNRRIVALPEITRGRPSGEMVGKFVRGGLLWQSADDLALGAADLKTVTDIAPTAKQIQTLLFAWRVVKHTKSNAIVIAKDCATVGIGMGQTSRVDSSFLAVKRAADRAQGACL